jgi:hypothetical protein
LVLNQLSAKRSQGKRNHFEMLFCPWDADDGDSQKNTKKQVGERNPYSSDNPPDDF